MINLTDKALPNTVMVQGVPFSVYTDFRLWMRFEIALSHMKSDGFLDVTYLFKDKIPSYVSIPDLLVFSRPQTVLPREMPHKSHATPFDFEIDGDLIFASFFQAYGIDLTETDLHWHKFLALFRNIPKGTALHDVIGYRLYKKDTRKDVDYMAELRDAWAVPTFSEDDDFEDDDFENLFI